MASRQVDPLARRLLADIRRLESTAWPAVRQAYAAALLVLATRCEAPAGKAELYRWYMRRAGGSLVVRDPTRARCRQDALHDVVADCAGLLLRIRAGLDDGKRPNLQSLLVAQVIWRAGDILRSQHERHTRLRAALEPCSVNPARPAGPDAAVLAREVGDQIDLDDRRERALLLVAEGHSIAEAARRTGSSRQQIYRARATVAARCGWHER